MKRKILVSGGGVVLVLLLIWFTVQITWRVGEVDGTVTAGDNRWPALPSGSRPRIL
jgi:hypothetical protein